VLVVLDARGASSFGAFLSGVVFTDRSHVIWGVAPRPRAGRAAWAGSRPGAVRPSPARSSVLSAPLTPRGFGDQPGQAPRNPGGATDDGAPGGLIGDGTSESDRELLGRSARLSNERIRCSAAVPTVHDAGLGGASTMAKDGDGDAQGR